MKKILIGLAIGVGISTAIAMAQNRFYPPTPDFDQAVQASLDKVLKDKIFDLTWKKTFHWLTLFESLDGYTKSAGVTPSTDEYIDFLTDGTNGNNQNLSKQPLYQGLITFANKSYFRSNIYFVNNTNQTIYLVVGLKTGSAYGFKAVNGTLFGVTRNGGSESTVSLGSISIGEDYNLEARYSPSDKVVFLVDSVEKGTLSANLPVPTSTPHQNLFYADITADAATIKEMQISFFEYMQFRDVLQ